MGRTLVTLFLAVAVMGTAAPAGAQYMFLDSNGDGLHTTADRMNSGVPTTVDVWVITNQNRDGSAAECNTADGDLTINSYVVNLAAPGGTVTYSGFTNRTPFTVGFGEVNTGNSLYKNGFGQQAALAPGKYRLCTITVTAVSGSPTLTIADIVNGSADFTSFGTQCSGNDFDNTYKLTGPGGGTDWTDVDGLASPEPINTPPVLAPIGNKSGFVGTCPPQPVTFTASATDSDLPPQALTFSLAPGAPAGATIHPSTGAFSWQPTSGGTFPVTVVVTDTGGLTDSETIQISILIVNQPPVLAAIGNKTVSEGSLLTFVATANNGTCPNLMFLSLGAGAPAGATITSGGTAGSASGTFMWTPTEAQGPGVFNVTIIVSSNNGSDTEVIQVTVLEANQAPVLSPIGNKSGGLGNTVTFTATATDADLPPNTLTFSLGAGAPATATINPTTGAFSWTVDQAGDNPITVIVTDNGTPALSDSETILIVAQDINTPPTLTPIGNKTVDEGSLVTFTATATDPDAGQTLTFSLGPGAPAGSTILAASGVFTWTPTEFQAPNVFPVTVRVTDNGTGNLSDSETIQITTREVNQAPFLGAIGNKTIPYTQTLTFTATATDADIPAQTLTFSLGAGAPSGATIGASSGIFSFTPMTTGVFPVTIIVTDNGTPAQNDTETIQITACDCPNLPPVLAAIGNKTVNEQALLNFIATATDVDAGQTLTFSLVPGAPAGAAITAGGNFTWTPTESQGPGVHSITVRVTDNGLSSLSDTETIQVTVNEVNVAPVLATIGNRLGQVGIPVTFTATATDVDVPANTLTFSLGAGAPAGATMGANGAFSWTPTTPVGSPFPVTVIVTDNGTPPLSDSETITIQVGDCAGNSAPVLSAIGNKTVNEQVLLTFTASATDPDAGQTLTFSLGAGAPAGATINAGGVFNWIPTEANGPGSFSVTIVVSDNGICNLSDSETIQITVNEVNQAPVLAVIGNKSVPVGSTLAFIATATDADLPVLLPLITFSLGAGSPAGAIITTAGAFSWTPASSGTFPCTVLATDSGSPALSDSETFQIIVTVGPANTAPVLGAIGNKTVNEHTTLTFVATATDSDIPVQALRFSLGAPIPPGAAITSAGNFTWFPAESQGGIIWPVTVVVTDNGIPALSDSETFQITVIETNIAPIMSPPSNMTVNAGATGTKQLLATDADIPSNPLTFSKVSGPPFVTVSAGGVVTASPGSNDEGTYTVTAQVSDGLATDTESFSLFVTNVNVTPVADAGGPYSGARGEPIFFYGFESSDPNGDPLTYSWDFGDGTTGSGVSTMHAYAVGGLYTVVLTVSDGSLTDEDTTTATVSEYYSINAFVTGGNKTVRLGSGKPQICVQNEPIAGAYNLSDVDLSSVRMGFGSNEIPAVSGKTTVGDDKDRNGVTEMTSCFSKENLRVLFAGTPTGEYAVTLRGDLITGGFFLGSLNLHVVNNGNFLSASISPNPLNPKATVSFVTSKPGTVRVQMFDVQGRLLRTLMDESNAAAGYHDVVIDGQDANGGRLGSGIYYVKIRTSSEGEVTKAVTILK